MEWCVPKYEIELMKGKRMRLRQDVLDREE